MYSGPRAGAVTLGSCKVQTAADRFGPDGRTAVRDRERVSQGLAPIGVEPPVNWPGQDPEALEHPDGRKTIYQVVPTMQPYRNNLTALSQTCNLYFVGYQGRIFVYRPGASPLQLLTQCPDLQLVPRSTKLGVAVGGAIDRRRPHTINHVITGMLGEREAVVACYDNGDVVAYDVRDIWNEVLRIDKLRSVAARKGSALPTQPRSTTQPFLHENVRQSAWGLAVHRQSRLIAVSSNLHEITVFAVALCGNHVTGATCEGCTDMKKQVQQRRRTWHIVVALGQDASNIPNVSFLDDEHGEADKVCGMDISGKAWIADIWNPREQCSYLKASMSSVASPFGNDGWGVLPLPIESFMVVHSMQDLLGGDTSIIPQNPSPAIVDINPLLRTLTNDPCAMARRRVPAVVHKPPSPPAENSAHHALLGNLPAPFSSMPPHSTASMSSVQDAWSTAWSTVMAAPLPFAPFAAGTQANPPFPSSLLSGGGDANGGAFLAALGAGSNAPVNADTMAADGNEEEMPDLLSVAGDEGEFANEAEPTQTEGTETTEDDAEDDDYMPDVQSLQGSEVDEEDSEHSDNADSDAEETGVPGSDDGEAAAGDDGPGVDSAPEGAAPGGLLAALITGTHETASAFPAPQWPNGPGSAFGPASASIWGNPWVVQPPVPFQPGPAIFTGTWLDSADPAPLNWSALPQDATGVASWSPASEPAGEAQPSVSWTPLPTGLATALSSYMPPSASAATQNFWRSSSYRKKPLREFRVKGPLSDCCQARFLATERGPLLLAMVYLPHDGQIMPPDDPARRKRRFNPRSARFDRPANAAISRRYRFLLTYGSDLALLAPPAAHLSTKNTVPEIRCTDALPKVRDLTGWSRGLFSATTRLSMLAQIPELSLLVIGSATGRVVLVTPTRMQGPSRTVYGDAWQYGFRVEAILPRASEESKKMPQGGRRPLHGVAVGPASYDGSGGAPGDGQAGPMRFRIVLHYRNHEIWTYEVGREKHEGRLCIF